MTGTDAVYGHEAVEHWENSSLDARSDPGGEDRRTPAYDPESLVEASYHAAAAGDVDAAAAMVYNYVRRGPEAEITSVVGGHEGALDVFSQFFSGGDFAMDARTVDPTARRWIMHETALCLHMVGRLSESILMATRAAALALRAGDDHNAAVSYNNLAESHLVNGSLTSSRVNAELALDLSARSGDREDALIAHTILGRLADLQERSEDARESYADALRIASEDTPFPMLYSLSGVRYADHLVQAGDVKAARHVAEKNRDFCAEREWQADVALVVAQLADVTDDSEVDVRRDYSERSVDLARSLGVKQVLVDVLLARARFLNRTGGPAAADVAREAMVVAQTHGFRCAEVDGRYQLAIAALAAGSVSDARAESELALDLAEGIDYRRAARAVTSFRAGLAP